MLFGRKFLALALVSALVAPLVGCSDDDNQKKKTGGDTALADTASDADAPDADEPDADEPDAALPDAVGDAGDGDADTTASADLYIDGLSAPVQVRYDEWGVLHIDCQTAADCYAAEGYFHADDRFFEMDMIRRQTRGQLSSLIGLTLGKSTDIKFQKLMATRDGKSLEEEYFKAVDQQTKEMLRAYASGVNAWIDDMRNGENGAELTEEYDFPAVDKSSVRDWEPEDTIALYLQLAYQLSFSADGDLHRNEMANTLAPAVAADLFSVKPGIVSNTYGASGATAPKSTFGAGGPTDPAAFRKARQRTRGAGDVVEKAHDFFESNPSMIFGPKDGMDGSNNWVLGPGRTKDGNALLANDPHLSLNNPAIWYYVELDAKTNGQGDLHVMGASIPAVPGIVVGQNEQVAWGVTTARLDLADAYIEHVTSDGNAVMRDGKRVGLIERKVTLKGKDGATKEVTFEYVPGHGPLVEKDASKNYGVSVKWVAQEAGNDIEFINDLMRAENVSQAMDALEPIRTINQNWIFMDTDGKIAWYPKSAIPKRPWASSSTPNWMPLPGDGSAEWDGYVSKSDAPKMVDPPKGFIATANNDFDGSYTDGDATNETHTPWQAPPANGHRHARIVEMIEDGGDKHTVETMNEIQSDTYSLHGEKLVPEIVSIANNQTLNSDLQNIVDALDNWQYTCPTGIDGNDPKNASDVTDQAVTRESAGCTAFHVLLPYLSDQVFSDDLAPASGYDAKSSWYGLQETLLYVFTAPGELNKSASYYFDDQSTGGTTETKGEIVKNALEAAGQTLQDNFGSMKAEDWRWGRIHTVTFASFFAQAGIDVYDNGPFANDGGYLTVDVANPQGRSGNFSGDFSHPNGPSLRVIFEAKSDGIEGRFQLPGGQDNVRDSKYYGSLIDEWLANEHKPLLFEESDLQGSVDREIEVAPTN